MTCKDDLLVLDVLASARNIILHPRYWTKHADARKFTPSPAIDNPLMQSPFDFYMICDPNDREARIFTAVGAIDRVIGKIDWKIRNKKFRKKAIKKFREKVIAAMNAHVGEYQSIWIFNGVKSVQHEDVIAVFNKAIEQYSDKTMEMKK